MRSCIVCLEACPAKDAIPLLGTSLELFICPPCCSIVEKGLSHILTTNLDESTQRTRFGLVRRLVADERLEIYLPGATELLAGHPPYGFRVIALSALLQDVPLEEMLLWCGNNRVDPIIDGLKTLKQPISVG